MLVVAYKISEFVPSIHRCTLFRCDGDDRVNHHRWRNSVCCSSIVAPATTDSKEIRVRFAPSPTGILHVGGARTALFNYLFARSKGGKFILRIEDTDLERSYKESEDSMLRELSWLDLQWDEGPDVGGNYGPYRQSERNNIYHHHLDRLMKLGHVYRCFCSDVELEKMKDVAREKQMPPINSGKWANASDTEIQREIDKGTPCVYRFRVPRGGQRLEINDLIRGKVSWNLDTIEDFVIMRSNGQPVYNFCVTVDDYTMAISHVIRAEEHLPNTFRQALIYKALGFQMPHFAHVSLILALDKSKLSKRHGATSVGQLREMGYLPQAIVNYLALLGWGDGTATQFFSIDMLVKRFSLGRVNKAGTIFDPVKMRWMNGKYLRSLPPGDLTELIGRRWESVGILSYSSGQFFTEAVEVVKGRIDVVSDADQILHDILSFPLLTTLSSGDNIQVLIENGISEVAMKLLDAYDNGELPSVIKGDGISEWKAWVNGFGNSLNRKGKALFIPLRVLMAGRMFGPDMGAVLSIVDKAGCCDVVCEGSGFVNMENRFKILKEVNWDTLVPSIGYS